MRARSGSKAAACVACLAAIVGMTVEVAKGKDVEKHQRDDSGARGRFWEMIGASRSGARDDTEFLRRLNGVVRRLNAEDLLEFERQRRRLDAEAYNWDLWGACYIINHGCSDDGFEYFRAWLIARGRGVFERVIRDPDALAEVLLENAELEDFTEVARRAYRQVAGHQMPDSVYSETPRPRLRKAWRFENASEMRKRYPRLYAKYGGSMAH